MQPVSAQSVDLTAPTVGAITPVTAQTNSVQTFSATYQDSVGVTNCTLYIDGASQGAMSLSGNANAGTASANFSFTTNGTHNLQARCADAAGNIGWGTMTSVFVTANGSLDVIAPTVGIVSPAAVQVNALTSFQVSYSDQVGVTRCTLLVDGANYGTMNLSSNAKNGTATINLSFAYSGTHTFQARCEDAAGNVGSGTITNMTVTASADTIAPTAPVNLQSSYLTGNIINFSWSGASDNVGIAGYEVQLDNQTTLEVGNVFNYTTGALSSGLHTFRVRTRDFAGNVSGWTSTTITVNIAFPPVPPSEEPQPTQPPFLLSQMSADASLVMTGNREALLSAIGRASCEFSDSVARTRVSQVFGNVETNTAILMANFIGCGTQTTLFLGAGERIGILNSFRAAYGRVPTTQAEWYDVIRIGNGRFPTTSASAEVAARTRFKLVYLRNPVLTVTSDTNAIVVMAYGLRPLPRNLHSEAAAIATFRAVFSRLPTSAIDWDTVRAIAYSGAVR